MALRRVRRAMCAVETDLLSNCTCAHKSRLIQSCNEMSKHGGNTEHWMH